MKPNEIKEMAEADLDQALKDARTELFNLRFQLATGQLDNAGRIQAVKKNIARVLTEMRTREIEAAREAAS